MRTLVLLGWLMVPFAFGAYHYGPGQEKLRLDSIAQLVAKADSLADGEQWQQAVSKYQEALALLPEGRVDDSRRIRLRQSKVQMFAHQLPEANTALQEIVDQLDDDKAADPKLRDEAREALANAQYYMTWLRRLEGLSNDEWEPEIESSRQTYKLLAEQDEARGDQVSARRHREDLESVIRLARLDLGELQGLDLPKQCSNCKSGQCNKPCKKPGKKPSKEPQKNDSRKAGMGPPPDNSGS
jgi:cell division septation protein DedD